MKEPKFKLGQKVYGAKCYNNDGKYEVVAGSIIGLHHYKDMQPSYMLDDPHNTFFEENDISACRKVAEKIAKRETTRYKIKHTEWELKSETDSIAYWQEKIADGPTELKKAQARLKKAEKELAKLKKKLEALS